jgi:hypothetical protein
VIYDDGNPFFAGAGDWQRWTWVFGISIRSWQDLIPLLPRRGRREGFERPVEKHWLTAV